MTLIKKAQKFATQAHKGQFRKDGKTPYIKHPEAVVNLLKQIGINNQDILSAAWLHDVIEDTSITLEQIQKEFNSNITRIVAALTRDVNRKKYNERIKNADFSIKIIKLADIIHNCRDINPSIPSITIKRKIKECKELYLNLAKEISPVFYNLIKTSPPAPNPPSSPPLSYFAQ